MTITDNDDLASISIEKLDGEICTLDHDCIFLVKENGKQEVYAIYLNSEPFSDVIESIQNNGTYGYEVTLWTVAEHPLLNETKDLLLEDNGLLNLTFTPEYWSQPQHVIIVAVDDPSEEPQLSPTEPYHVGQILHSSYSSNTLYNQLPLPMLIPHIWKTI